jgi:hypothetical protein
MEEFYMKLLRKLSLLIALCVCLTFGGVYAAWIFTESTDVADQHQHLSVSMTEAQFSGSYGSFHVDYSSLSMTIDPTVEGGHVAALKITGKIVITFVPNQYAPAEVKTSGVATTWQLATNIAQNTWTYNSTQIFTVNTDKVNVVWGTPDGQGVFTYEISAETLAAKIQLGTFTLDTKAEYDAFNTELGKGKIGITVSDGVTTPPAGQGV